MHAGPDPVPPGGLTDETRTLVGLAWPIVLGQVGLVTMGLVDVAVCGREGADVLAAVGAGRIFSFGILLFGFGALRGIEPIFAQAWGAGERDRMGAALAHCLAFALVLAVPLAALHGLAGPALSLLGQPPEIIPAAHDYTVVRAVGVPAALVFSGLTAWLQGQGRVRAPMVVVGVANVVNLVLDLLLIRGATFPGGVVLPAYGATGCAWASTAVEWLAAAVLLWLCSDGVRAALGTARSTVFAPAAWRRMAGLGLPVGVQTSLEVWAFNLAGLMVGTLGAAALGAHVIAMQLISLTFMVPFGIGAAASARVGNLVGAGHGWRRTGFIAVALGALWMGGSSVALLLLGEGVVGAFTDDGTVIAITLTLLPVAAVFQVADGIQAVAFGVLRGAGDTRVPALVNVLAYWVLGIPVGYVVGLQITGEPWGVWSGLAVGLTAVSALMIGRMWLVSGRTTRRV